MTKPITEAELKKLRIHYNARNNLLGIQQIQNTSVLEDATALLDEIDRLQKRLMEHGEALIVLEQLRILYKLSPNMLEKQTQSAAKLMMKHCEEGLRLSRERQIDEYTAELKDENKRLREALEEIRTRPRKRHPMAIATEALTPKEAADADTKNS